MVDAAQYIVVGRDGRVACKGWRSAAGYAKGFTWRDCRGAAPPDYLLTWGTREGAQKFAHMNGGNVMTVMDYFYAPAQAAAI